MLVLGLDTSSEAVSASLVEFTVQTVTERASRVAVNARAHGELLAPLIAQCLAEIGASAADLDAVVTGIGPGPYTGLRVGMVSAAVLAESRGIPVYGVCSLDALGDAGREEAVLLVATDARRREVYWARYDHGTRVGEPAVDRPDAVSLLGVTALSGAGAQLYDLGGATIRRRAELYPSPVSLVRCARDRVLAGASSDPMLPLYLRRPDAVEPALSKPVTQ